MVTRHDNSISSISASQSTVLLKNISDVVNGEKPKKQVGTLYTEHNIKENAT